MKKIIPALLLLACLTIRGHAQENMSNKRFIEVTGTNEMEIVPNEITLIITLAESKETPPIQKQEDELRRNVKELGIDLANLTLNSADADYHRIRMFKKDVVITKSYQLKINNADMVGRVYEKLDKMNASDAYILDVDHTKMTELKKESRIKAIQAAKEKVDYLLAAVGQQAGQPIQINEIEIYAPVYANNMMKRSFAAADASGGEGEISFKKIKIKTSISVKYEILSK